MEINEYFSIKELIFFLRGRHFTEKEAKEIREILDIGTKHLNVKSPEDEVSERVNVFRDSTWMNGSVLQQPSYGSYDRSSYCEEEEDDNSGWFINYL